MTHCYYVGVHDEGHQHILWSVKDTFQRYKLWQILNLNTGEYVYLKCYQVCVTGIVRPKYYPTFYQKFKTLKISDLNELVIRYSACCMLVYSIEIWKE